MLHCFNSSSQQSSSHPAGNHYLPSQGDILGNAPRSNALSSPNVDTLFSKVTCTESYNEVWNTILRNDNDVEEWENGDVNQVQASNLQPNHKSVQEVLKQASTNPYIHHLSTYFNHTERIWDLLLLLIRGIRCTRSLYAPIEKLIEILPSDSDSLNQEECNWAYGIFHQFDKTENPFRGSYNFNHMHSCFSDLKAEVDSRRINSKPGTCTAKCFTFAVTAASVAAHALAALVRRSSFPPVPKLTKKDLAHIALLEAAAQSAYNLHNELQTIDRLACNLQTEIEEGDRRKIRVGIGAGPESYPICVVVKRLASSHPKIRLLLQDLEVHICLCFTTINKARSLLLQEIDKVHQS